MSLKEIDPITTRMRWDIMKLKFGNSVLVKDIMRKATPHISRERPIKDALEMQGETGSQCLLVMDKDEIAGIFTREYAETALVSKGSQHIKVGDLVSPTADVSESMTILEATRIMGKKGSRQALVRDEDGGIIGHTSLDDILIISPELIRVFSTIESLVGLALESEVDITVHLQDKLKELAKEGVDLESLLQDYESPEFKGALERLFNDSISG